MVTNIFGLAPVSFPIGVPLFPSKSGVTVVEPTSPERPAVVPTEPVTPEVSIPTLPPADPLPPEVAPLPPLVSFNAPTPVSWHQAVIAGSQPPGTGEFNLIESAPGKSVLLGTVGDDQINGGISNDLLMGLDGNDLLNGYAGDDSLLGGNGSDFLLGGAGNDNLYGGTGTDFLQGGLGHDSLTGEADSDVFIWASADLGEGVDTIMDFEAAIGASMDFIDLSQIHTILPGQLLEEVVDIRQLGTDTVLGLKTTDALTGVTQVNDFAVLKNVIATEVTAANFILPAVI